MLVLAVVDMHIATMGPITTISTDIMLLILHHLPTSAKAALALTCKSLNEIVGPTIYENIEMHWTPDNASGRTSPRGPPIHLLLRTMLESPELALLVTHVKFFGNKNKTIWWDPTQAQLTETEVARIITLIEGLDIPEDLTIPSSTVAREQNTLLYQARSGNTELYQALFLLQLHNLQSLVIGYDYVGSPVVTCDILQRYLCSSVSETELSRFRHLHRVELCNDMEREDLEDFMMIAGFQHSLHHILPFFYLPALQDLRVVAPSSSSPALWPTTSPCASTLTALHLRRSELLAEDLSTILSVTPNLTHLNIDLCSEIDIQTWGTPSLNCSEFDAALHHVAQSLISLEISVKFYTFCNIWHGDQIFMSTIEGVMNFARFRRLESLHIPAVLLLGHCTPTDRNVFGRLPTTLHSLSLRDDLALYLSYPWSSHALLESLQVSLDARSLSVPVLERIDVILHESGQEWNEESRNAFRKMCHTAGLASQIYADLAERVS
jgi:hypothetical protein